MQKSILAILIALFLNSSCGQHPDSLGRCNLDCRNAYLGSTTMRIRYLTGDPSEFGAPEMSVSCAGESSYPGAVPIRFVIERPRQLTPIEADTTPIGGEIPANVDGAEAALHWEPAGGVAFLPVINGGVITGAIAEDKSKWCTDSCGIGVASFRPKCASQTIEFGVYSGALANKISISISP